MTDNVQPIVPVIASDWRDRRIAELEAQLEQARAENTALKAEIARLKQCMAELERAGKRQATPFARDEHKADPKKPAGKWRSPMRKLKYHVASTLDGFIAHQDHTIDGFIMEGEHVTDYLASLKNDYDTVLMGRRTYEFGFQFGVTNPYPWMKQYVFSRTMERSPDPNVELVSENIIDLVREQKRSTGKDIYLCGGADLAATLFAADLVDEIILKLNPVLFGSGIPLFSGAIQQTDPELIDNKIYGNGVVLLHYRVKR